jgi:molybdate transport system substrate-binding protein
VNAVSIPDEINVISTYPIAVIVGSPNTDAAQAFVDHVTGSAGQAVLTDYGFLPLPTM